MPILESWEIVENMFSKQSSKQKVQSSFYDDDLV